MPKGKQRIKPAKSCQKCQRKFKNIANYRRHARANTCASGGRHRCTHCNASFVRRDAMEKHRRNMHENSLCYACGVCPLYFSSMKSLKSHREEEHTYSTRFILNKSAHKRQAENYRMHFPDAVTTVDEAYAYSGKEIRKLLTGIFKRTSRFRANMVLGLEMYKTNEEGLVTALENFSFRASGVTLDSIKDIKHCLTKGRSDIDRNIAEFLFQGSGWKILRPFMLDVELVEVRALSGGGGSNLHVASYGYKRGIVPCATGTVLDDDGYCFYAAVAACVLGSGKPYSELENWFSPAAAEFGPHVAVKDIGKIENFWRSHTEFKRLSLNVVYKDEDGKILPVRVGKDPLGPHQVALLLSYTTALDGSDGHAVRKQDVVCHYSAILDYNNLFSNRRRQSSSNKITTRSQHLCWNCLNTYSCSEALASHITYCGENNCQKVTMPRPGETISYKEKVKRREDGSYPTPKQSRAALKAAYVLYFDFEALNVTPDKVCSCPPELVQRRKDFEARQLEMKLASDEQLAEWKLEDNMLAGEQSAELESEIFHLSDNGNSKKKLPTFPPEPRMKKMCPHKTSIVSEQKPFSYSYCLMNREGEVLETKVIHSENDAAECFIEDVLNISHTYMPELTPGRPMKEMTSEELDDAMGAEVCYLCLEEFDEDEKNLARVLDHDHLTGNFLGVAHSICNLHRKEDYSLTCFSHNFSGYDSHFIVKALNHLGPERVGQLKAIPLNTQKFKSITLNNRVKFTDSAAFLNASLSDCADTLVKSDHAFKLLDSICDTVEQKKLLLRKGVYPYSFATSIDKLESTEKLPPKEAFYNDLTDTPVSDEDYAHAEKVWRAFNMTNMMEYTTLYLRTDTLLLAEVMTELRDSMWRDFELDLTRYLSLPMMAKDIMLKTTGVELELITDQEMSDLIQKNLRGGLSFINKRKGQKLDADESGGPRSIVYTDCTNLYGKAMCMPLPLDNFAWMTREELDSFSPETDVSEDSETGYFLEVDLMYPAELHEAHNSFPLAAQPIDLTEKDLSPYSYSCLQALSGGKKKYSARKLTSTFYPRTKYLCHGLNLQLYLKLGMKLVRVHRGIKFRQQRFIKPYIEMCSERRRTAPTEAQRNMYKLLCNSLYGKLIEGFEKRMKCKFNRDRLTALRNSSHPLYKGTMICGEDLSITFHKLSEFRMNQSWAVGFSVLELSKYWMQKSYYCDIAPAFKDHGGCCVLMSDTDSFLLETKMPSADHAVSVIKDVMDTSNYPVEHSLHRSDRAKVPGYFKNEIPRAEIELFVGLKSKTYAIRCSRGKTEMKAKGIPQRQKHKIPMQEMLNCLEEMRSVELEYHGLRSYDHVNKLVKCTRVAFSSFDDKRYLTCEIHSVPYGSRCIALSKKIKRCYLCVREKDPTFNLI